MKENSPNAELIDVFEGRIQERFTQERLSDYALDRLNEERWLLENEFVMYETTFPPRGGLEGRTRAVINDDPFDPREALTDDERMRLRHIKRRALGEIYRAEGKRKEKNREHRLKVYNTAGDFLRSLSKSVSALLPPW